MLWAMDLNKVNRLATTVPGVIKVLVSPLVAVAVAVAVAVERKMGITGVPFGRTEVSIPFV